jgi:ribonuclease D
MPVVADVSFRLVAQGVGEFSCHWIDTEAQWQEAAAFLTNAPAVAIDTEFFREHTYFAELGLVQLAVPGQVFLFDPLALDPAKHLAPLLASADTVKVFHSASEDLQVLKHVAGPVVGMFDCQVAASFVGLGDGLGLHRLVETLFDVTLDKEATRSDWLARPLTPTQLHYAALDTAYLLPALDILQAQLVQRGMAQWNTQENDRRLMAAAEDIDFEHAFRRIRSHERLTGPEQHRLQRLAAWREETAKERNMPRSRVAKDGQLVALAKLRTLRRAALHECGLHPKTIRQFGDELVGLVQRSKVAHDAQPLSARVDKELSAQLFGPLQAAVENKAGALGISAQLVAPRRDLDAVLLAFQQANRSIEHVVLPAKLCGWRHDLLMDALRCAVAGGDEHHAT